METNFFLLNLFIVTTLACSSGKIKRPTEKENFKIHNMKHWADPRKRWEHSCGPDSNQVAKITGGRWWNLQSAFIFSFANFIYIFIPSLFPAYFLFSASSVVYKFHIHLYYQLSLKIRGSDNTGPAVRQLTTLCHLSVDAPLYKAGPLGSHHPQ